MAPVENLPEHTGLIAGILASIAAVWFAVTGRHRERDAEMAVAAVEASGKFVLRATQDEINRGLQEDVRRVGKTVDDIYAYLLGSTFRHDRQQDD